MSILGEEAEGGGTIVPCYGQSRRRRGERRSSREFILTEEGRALASFWLDAKRKGRV